MSQYTHEHNGFVQEFSPISHSSFRREPRKVNLEKGGIMAHRVPVIMRYSANWNRKAINARNFPLRFAKGVQELGNACVICKMIAPTINKSYVY